MFFFLFSFLFSCFPVFLDFFSCFPLSLFFPVVFCLISLRVVGKTLYFVLFSEKYFKFLRDTFRNRFLLANWAMMLHFQMPLLWEELNGKIDSCFRPDSWWKECFEGFCSSFAMLFPFLSALWNCRQLLTEFWQGRHSRRLRVSNNSHIDDVVFDGRSASRLSAHVPRRTAVQTVWKGEGRVLFRPGKKKR